MARWEGREVSSSWGLGSRAAGVFLELSFPSASSEQVKTPQRALHWSPPPPPPPPSAVSSPMLGGGEVRLAVWGLQARGMRWWGSIIPDPSPPAPPPLPPSKSLWGGESIPGGGNGKCKGCGFRMWRRGKPASLAGTEVRGPPGIAQWRRTCLTRGREGEREREMQWTQPVLRMPEAGQWLGDHSASEHSPLYPLALRQGLCGGVRVILPGPSAPESLCSGSSVPGTGSWRLCFLSLCIPSSPTRSVQFPPFYR